MMNEPRQPSRRQFLAAAGVALSAPAAFARTRLGPGPTGPNQRVTTGVIGIGIRGRNLMHGAFLPNDGFQVLAVCDVDETRREDGKRRVDEHYGNQDCKAYNDYRALLARDDIDAVVIATPDHWHANQIIHACQAGKDIYCEKPLTLTLHEAKVVIEAVRKAGSVFQTGSQQRTEFDHRFVTACEYVRNGRIGRLHNVNVGVGDAPTPCDLEQEELPKGLDWDRWLGPAPRRAYNSILSPRGVHSHYPKWRSYREYAGGGLADMGAHHFDIAQWALKADESGPVRVFPPSVAKSKRGAWVEYDDGTKVIHGGISGATFVGASGVLHVDRGRLASVPAKILGTELDGDSERLPRKKNHATDWLDCIRDRSRPICDVEVGARSVAVCHLLNIAYWHQRALMWDPKNWRFGESFANPWLDYQRRAGYELPKL